MIPFNVLRMRNPPAAGGSAPAFTGNAGFGAYDTANGTGSYSETSSFTTVTGRGALVVVSGEDNTALLTIGDNKSNGAPTQIGTTLSGTQFGFTFFLQVFYYPSLANGGSGHIFTATKSSGVDQFTSIWVGELDRAVTLDTTVGSSVAPSGPWTAPSITTGANNCLVIAAGGIPDGNPYSVAASGFTEVFSLGNGAEWGVCALAKTVPVSGSSNAPSISSSPGSNNSETAFIRMISLK